MVFIVIAVKTVRFWIMGRFFYILQVGFVTFKVGLIERAQLFVLRFNFIIWQKHAKTLGRIYV